VQQGDTAGFCAAQAATRPIKAPWDCAAMKSRWNACGAKIQIAAKGIRLTSFCSVGKDAREIEQRREEELPEVIEGAQEVVGALWASSSRPRE